MTEEGLVKISEFATRSDVSADTVRYYERIGLLPRVDRDGAGHRDYDADDLAWLAFLQRLRTTGMPIRDMLRYAGLRAEGAATLSARREILFEHRKSVRAQIAALRSDLTALDQKITTYDDMILSEGNADA